MIKNQSTPELGNQYTTIYMYLYFTIYKYIFFSGPKNPTTPTQVPKKNSFL